MKVFACTRYHTINVGTAARPQARDIDFYAAVIVAPDIAAAMAMLPQFEGLHYPAEGWNIKEIEMEGQRIVLLGHLES